MASRPDFVVDPQGRARDVRREKYGQQGASATPRTRYHTSRPGSVRTGPHRGPQREGGSRPGVILIPVGLIITLVVAFVRYCVLPTDERQQPERDVVGLGMGNAALARGDTEDALRYLNIAVGSDPSSGEAHNSRGIANYVQGEYDQALADFHRAIARMPDWAGAYSNRGICYHAKGEHARALADLGEALRLDPDFGKAYLNRGLVHYALGDYDAAIADFDDAIRSTDELSYAILSEAPSRGDGQLVDGLLSRWQLEDTGADLALAYEYRGYAYLAKGDLDRFTADMEKASGLDLDLGQLGRQRLEDVLEEVQPDALESGPLPELIPDSAP